MFEVRDGPPKSLPPICAVLVGFFPLPREFSLVSAFFTSGSGLKVFGCRLIGFPAPDGDGVGDIREELLVQLPND